MHGDSVDFIAIGSIGSHCQSTESANMKLLEAKLPLDIQSQRLNIVLSSS
jgi:hypothetical protein